MLHLRDSIAGDAIRFYQVQSKQDLRQVSAFVRNHRTLGIDTESTGLNPYVPGWKLRTVQIATANVSIVIPARYERFITWLMRQKVRWVGHNGPHDIRSIDAHLGFDTGVVCPGETFILSHYYDPRNRDEGGIGHGLKEMAQALIDHSAGKWEKELHRVFKTIKVPVPGEYYKSGPRKGLLKERIIKLSEGWALIDPNHSAYVAYAAADPLLTIRLWHKLNAVYRDNRDLYASDMRVQQAADRLTRRALLIDVPYTERKDQQFRQKADRLMERAETYGCAKIYSGDQITEVLQTLGVRLTKKTPTGKFSTTDKVLRGIRNRPDCPAEAADFIRTLLLAKQCLKRATAYTGEFLASRDVNNRIHPSINTLAAVTARMSVSNPALQQLPTRQGEDD